LKASKQNRREILLAALGGLIAQLANSEAIAQDPARVMPRAYRVAFENDQVRVLDFVGRPGMGICGEGMHSHPAHLTVVMTDWQGVVSTPGSGAQPRQRKAGDVFWAEAETHKLENTGKSNTRVLIVELKSPPKQNT
jgi:quercetin dioxygenase-like cupin family protein